MERFPLSHIAPHCSGFEELLSALSIGTSSTDDNGETQTEDPHAGHNHRRRKRSNRGNRLHRRKRDVDTTVRILSFLEISTLVTLTLA